MMVAKLGSNFRWGYMGTAFGYRQVARCFCFWHSRRISYRNLERGVLFAWQVKTKLTIDRFCEKSWQVMTEQFWTKKHRPGELFQNSESYIIHMQNS